MLRFLQKLLAGGGVYPFEERILAEVMARLHEEARARLQRQIDVINKVQRLSGGRDVNLYQMRGGSAAFDDSLRFPNAPAELLLASVNLALPNHNEVLKVELWMAEGRLFSLEFNRAPKQFFSGVDLREAQPEIVDVKIHSDLE